MVKKSTNKEIQRERVSNYFLNATIEIIKEEGLDNLTTKKIGDRAGYSYATIYNYFENFNELICKAMLSMADECASFINENIKGNNIYELCYNFSDLMVEYNAKNPNIYYPFLSTSVDFSYFEDENNTHFIHPAYNIIFSEITKCPEMNNRDTKELYILLDIFTSIFHSALHFYIVLNNPKTIVDLKLIIKEQIRFLLEKFL